MTQKFRAYDTKVLTDNMTIVSQMRQKIEAVLEHGADNFTLSDLPASYIPTDTFYNILVCYEVMFDSLVKEHLVKDGHLKPSSTIH